MRYNIVGEPFPVVICELEPGEQMITESGSMAWISLFIDTMLYAAESRLGGNTFL